MAIERVGSFDEYMNIPGYGVDSLLTYHEKRYEACKQRYQGMEEYMEIPDMDLWLKLKNEIIFAKIREREFQTVNISMADDDYESDYSMDNIDKQERRYLRFKDKWV